MNFRNLIGRYSQTVSVLSNICGDYNADTGEWERGMEAGEFITAAVLPVSEDLLQAAGGSYTSDDREIYTHANIAHGQRLGIDGTEYRVAEEQSYEYLASGLRIYVITRKGASDD